MKFSSEIKICLLLILTGLISCGKDEAYDWSGLSYVNLDISEDFVDLGLSVKWGTRNINAAYPWENGGYYAWGEIETKSVYLLYNSITTGISMEDFSGNVKYDVATMMNSKWRLPTKDEIEELVNKCKWSWKAICNKQGYLITGPNGNSIFLPAASSAGNLVPAQSYGHIGYFKYALGEYWSSTPCKYSEDRDYEDAWRLSFSLNSYGIYRNVRSAGLPIRPVSD